MDTSFDAGSRLSGPVNSVIAQPDGKIVIGGSFSSVRGAARNNIARLNPDGTVDDTFDPGTGFSNVVTSVVMQPDGKLVVGGSFTSFNGVSRRRIARLNADGSLDTSFNPGSGADAVINTVTLQPDGKVVIAGSFTNYSGTRRVYVARLNENGSLDAGFNPTNFVPAAGTNSNKYYASAAAVQTDGKVLVAGWFSNSIFNGIGRLNENGSLDDTFTPGSGADYFVNCLLIQPDGKTVIGGDFISYNGTNRSRLARLNADGSLDSVFDPGTGANGTVTVLNRQADGTFLVGGRFYMFNRTKQNYYARVGPNGSLDSSFNSGTGASNSVGSIVTQADGKVLLGGAFPGINGIRQGYLARLDASGNWDPTLNPNSGADNEVYSVVLQPDGKVVAGGLFTSVNRTNQGLIVRLNTDGSLDETFVTPSHPGGQFQSIYAILLQPDGEMVIGGTFTNIGGASRSRIARLNANGSLDLSFDPGTGVNQGLFGYQINAIAQQPDGKLLIGGSLSEFNGTNVSAVARLNTNGSLDTTFAPNISGEIFALAIQSDGKVLIGGVVSSTFGGSNGWGVARLHTNGIVDTNFVSPITYSGTRVYAISLYPDDSMVVGGFFTAIAGLVQPYLARLGRDGNLDLTFNTGSGPNTDVKSIALQAGGKMVIAGSFSSVNGVPRRRIARLNADGSVDTKFDTSKGAPGFVYSLASGPDGKSVIAGNFVTVNGLARAYIARLYGDPYDLIIQKVSDQLDQAVLIWTSIGFSLQASPLLGGPYTNVPGATSPYTNSLTDPQRYFRLKNN